MGQWIIQVFKPRSVIQPVEPHYLRIIPPSSRLVSQTHNLGQAFLLAGTAMYFGQLTIRLVLKTVRQGFTAMVSSTPRKFGPTAKSRKITLATLPPI